MAEPVKSTIPPVTHINSMGEVIAAVETVGLRAQAQIIREYVDLATSRIRAREQVLENAEAENTRLRTALRQAGAWFAEYADRHTAKGDADKAARNQERADFCRRAAEIKGE